jgi:uncharacterized glyoxalase superfamily protein PhnB
MYHRICCLELPVNLHLYVDSGRQNRHGARIFQRQIFFGKECREPEGEDLVLHARMEIGGTVLIGNDVPADRFQPMRSAYLYLGVDSVEDAERIYSLLVESVHAYMPLQETLFASRFSQLRDQFGTLWTLIHERPVS